MDMYIHHYLTELIAFSAEINIISHNYNFNLHLVILYVLIITTY